MASPQFQFAVNIVGGRLPKRSSKDLLKKVRFSHDKHMVNHLAHVSIDSQTPDDKTITPFEKLARVLREMEHQLGEDADISIVRSQNTMTDRKR